VADDPLLATKRRRVDELIAYHSEISSRLTKERTSLESRLIPVSAYVIVSCIEALSRYPDMMRRIDAAMPAEEIGRRARRPGCRVNTVHLWTLANLPLVGRKVLGTIDPSAGSDVDALHTIFDFWERAARAYRGDGTLQAWDTNTVKPYTDPAGDDAVLQALLAGVADVDDEQRSRIKRFNATLISYLFLLYFDTRVGAGDSGPYELADGRVALVRDYYQMGVSDFWWSDVACDVPYQNLTATFVLEGVTIDRITDFGTSNTTPEDYLDHVVGFGLSAPDPRTGELRRVPLDELDDIVVRIRGAQSAHYRNIAKMTRDDKIRCGAYVYFGFLRPFAQEAGIENELDWTVPRDIDPVLYEMVSAMEGDNSGVQDEGPYYAPLR
jgi:hypothetical protein